MNYFPSVDNRLYIYSKCNQLAPGNSIFDFTSQKSTCSSCGTYVTFTSFTLDWYKHSKIPERLHLRWTTHATTWWPSKPAESFCSGLQKLPGKFDTCFKIFYIMDIRYPWQCTVAWEFLQKVIYSMEDKVKHNIQDKVKHSALKSD